MFSTGRSLFITKECIKPRLRDEMLDYFNKDVRAVNMALAANVVTLPTDRDKPAVTEQVLFMHPYNLVDEIGNRISQGERDAACIRFDPNTCVLDVCLGRKIDVQIYLNNKDCV